MVIRTSQLVINKFVTSPNCWSYIRYTDMYDVRGSVKAKTIDSIDEQCIVSAYSTLIGRTCTVKLQLFVVG